MKGMTAKCPGVCKGDPAWRAPETGLPCSCCGGTGEITTYNQRELQAEEWDRVVAERRLRGQKPRDARGPGSTTFDDIGDQEGEP